MAIRLSTTQRDTIRAALPFQSDYPTLAIRAALNGSVPHRIRDELARCREARAALRSSVPGYERGWYSQQLSDARAFLANLRTARRLVREA